MQLPMAIVALCALLAAAGPAQARPEATSTMTEASTEAPTSTPAFETTPAASASDEDSSSEEDKNITVRSKMAALCPPQQPDLHAVEEECLATVEPSCLPNESFKSSSEMTTEAATSSSTIETTPSPDEKCKSICNYHQCILEKLEVLDSSGKPNKMLLSNWIANNITDEKVKEQLQHKLSQCTSKLPEGSLTSSDDSKTTEEEENGDTKNKNTNSKCCKTAKKVTRCIFNTECPVIKLL